MPVPSISSERRSTRIFLRVRVVVAGRNTDGRRFREACETIVINAHGGLVYLNQPVAMDAMLVLTNPFTQEEQECRIVYLGEASRSRISFPRTALLGRGARPRRLVWTLSCSFRRFRQDSLRYQLTTCPQVPSPFRTYGNPPFGSYLFLYLKGPSEQ